MKIETQPREDHQVTLIVEINPEQMEGARHRAARRISERTKIPGFRPGKVPYDVVRRYVGDSAISEQAVDLLLDEVYPEALKEAKVTASGPGSLEKVESLEPPKFVFTVPLMPSVDLGKYRAVRLAYEWKEPGDDKVDEAIEELRRMYSKTETVDRPVQMGDFVMIDLKGSKENGAEGEAPVIDRPGYPVFIRLDEKADEWPFMGFSKDLVGLKAGESKVFAHSFETEHKDESLHGQTVRFEVNVKMVRGAILPELNDEFAKMTGPFENLQALKQAVHANLSVQSKADYDDAYFVQLVDKIKESATIKYPPQILDHEVEHVMEDLKARLAEQGLDMQAYLKSRQMDEEKFVAEEARPIAVRRLERSLILEELARAEKVEISQETLNEVFQQTWGEFRASDDFRRVMRGKTNPPKRLLDAVAMQSANRAITQQTLTRLKQIATGQVEEATSEEKPKKVPTGKSRGVKTPGSGRKASSTRPSAQKAAGEKSKARKSTKEKKD